MRPSILNIIIALFGVLVLFSACTSDPCIIEKGKSVFLNDANINESCLPAFLDIDLGDWRSRRYLQTGWSTDERDADQVTFVWMLENKGLLTFPLQAVKDVTVSIRCRLFAFEKWTNRTISFQINRFTLNPAEVTDGWNDLTFTVPSHALNRGINTIVLTAEHSFRPSHIIPGSKDNRKLSIAVDRIKIGNPDEKGDPTSWNYDWRTRNEESIQSFLLAAGESIEWNLPSGSVYNLDFAVSLESVKKSSVSPAQLQIMLKNKHRSDQDLATVHSDEVVSAGENPWLRKNIRIETANSGTSKLIIKSVSESEIDTDGLYWLVAGLQIQPAQQTSAGKAENILLISIDTLRADHLGAWGNPSACSITLDRLAQNGIQFPRCYSNTDITNPSHLSILLSQYLKDHGVYNNTQVYNGLGKSIASACTETGMMTCAVSSAKHLNRIYSGIPGFTSWYDVRDITQNASAATEKAMSWIDTHRTESWMLWLHIFDPHTPYEPPEPFLRRHYPILDSRLVENGWDKVVFDPQWNNYMEGWLKGTRNTDFPKAAYQGEIDYVSQEIDRLIVYLARNHLLDSTMVAVIADHGESLGEHNIWYDHEGLYEPQTHIPLMIHYPQSKEARHLDNRLIQSIDLAPTLLKLHNINIPAEFCGENLMGNATQASDRSDTIFMESRDHLAVAARNPHVRIVETLKDYFHASRGTEIISDNTEPLMKESAFEQIRIDLMNRMSGYKKLIPPAKEEPGIRDDELIKQLQALGYAVPEPDEE